VPATGLKRRGCGTVPRAAATRHRSVSPQNQEPHVRPARKERKGVVRRAGILGVGFDSSDGHTHITRGDNFFLIGGSESTHQELQAKVAHFNRELQRLGKAIEDLTESEIDEIARQLQ
jgi:hypothetical protein